MKFNKTKSIPRGVILNFPWNNSNYPKGKTIRNRAGRNFIFCQVFFKTDGYDLFADWGKKTGCIGHEEVRYDSPAVILDQVAELEKGIGELRGMVR